MLLKTKELFELPVYRLTESRYLEEFQAWRSRQKSPELWSIDEFGGDWDYNEIVGFLRFYRSGSTQIRCEYWQTSAKRKCKTKTKTFIMTSDSYCRSEFFRSMDNEALKRVVRECIEHCQARLLGRHVDMRLFDSSFEYIDWKKLLFEA